MLVHSRWIGGRTWVPFGTGKGSLGGKGKGSRGPLAWAWQWTSFAGAFLLAILTSTGHGIGPGLFLSGAFGRGVVDLEMYDNME